MSRFDQYDFVETVAPGVVVIKRNGNDAVWALCTTRKPYKCSVDGAEFPKGSDAYRPVGNKQYRYERICAAHIDAVTAPPQEPTP